MTPSPRSALVSFLVLAGCGVEEVDLADEAQEVVDGLVTTDGRIVKIWDQGVAPTDANIHCTGTLITSSTVLTAGHCVVTGGVYQTSAFTGTATVHPGFHPGTLANDVAVISTLDKVGRPSMRLGRAAAAGQAIRISGYGVLAPGSWPTGHLRTGTNTIDSVSAQRLLYSASTPFGPTPDGLDVGTCSGDSGGPVVRDGTDCILGVTSDQLTPSGQDHLFCTAAGGAFAATKVEPYLAWIDGVTRDPLRICP